MSSLPHLFTSGRTIWAHECGERLRAARQAAGLTMAEAANLAGITTSMWNNREMGEVWNQLHMNNAILQQLQKQLKRHEACRDQFRVIAEAVGVSLESLIE